MSVGFAPSFLTRTAFAAGTTARAKRLIAIFQRDRQFWGEEGFIQPGKIVGWIFATEDKGARMK